MTDNERLALLGLGALAFLIWRRSQPAAIIGVQLPKPDAPIYQTFAGPLSPVKPSASTSQLATNPASFAGATSYDPGWAVLTRPGNAPLTIYANRGGYTAQDVGQPANGFTSLAAPTGEFTDTLPFWQTDPNFANPAPNDWSGLAYGGPSIATFMGKPVVY